MLKFKVLTVNQIRICENKYIKKYSFNKLINLAAKKIANFLTKNYGEKKILFICGFGNNGKDGKLAFKKIQAKTKSSIISLEKNKKIDEEQIKKVIQKNDVIIDCIFGIGLNRNVKGDLEKVIRIINNSNKSVVSIDIPSGLNGDSGEIMGICVKAKLTLALGFYKPGHFLLPGKSFSGNVYRLSLNLDLNKNFKPKITLVNKSYFMEKFPSYGPEVHKYNKGHVIVIGGKMAGASRLVALAARKVGCGLSTILIERKNSALYSNSEPGTIIENLTLDILKNKDVLVIGPGLGKEFNKNKILKIITIFKGPIIVDADAISIFKDHKSSFLKLLRTKQNLILTPHEGEFKRIFNDKFLSKIQKCYHASKTINNCILLKGNDSVACFSDHNIWINNLAETKLATAGSGDMLCGILAGLLAQKMEINYSVIASIWIHSMVSKSKGIFAVEDFLNELPVIMASIKKKN